MFESVDIGDIKECGSKKYVKWTIKNYFFISQQMNRCIKSPSFLFCDEMWYLIIYPRGQNTTDCAGWVGIYLKKLYPTGFKRNVNFKIGIGKFGGPEYESFKGAIISEETLCWGTSKLCKQSDLRNDNSILGPFNVLTVFCTLQVNKGLFAELLQKTSSIKEKCIAGIDRTLKFDPPTGIDTMVERGVSTLINTRLQCITAMKEFENESLEELRLEYCASDDEKAKSLRLKHPINKSSAFLSATTASLSATTASGFFKTSSFSENRKIVRATKWRKQRHVVDDAKKESNLFGVTQKESTSGFKFGSQFETKPLTGIATSNNEVNAMIRSFKQFKFGSTSTQNHDKNVASETEDNRPSLAFGISSQKSSAFSFGNIVPAKPLGSTEATNKNTASETEDCCPLFSFGNSSQKSGTFISGSTIPVTSLFRTTEATSLNKLSEDLKEFYVSSKDTDMILKVRDKEFKVHKYILMARSPVFAKMFRHDMVEKIDGFVEITDCDSDIFQEFLLYLYSGKVEKIYSDRVFGLYQISDKYDLQFVKSLCTKFMIQNLCAENFCETLRLAVRFKESAVLESATKFFVKNMKNIIVTVDWLNFHKEYPVEANELHIKALN